MFRADRIEATRDSIWNNTLYTAEITTDEPDLMQEIINQDPRSFYYKKELGYMFGSRPRKDMEIKDVIFNNPATIVKWKDGSKTVVKCNPKYDDAYDPEKGLAMAICKKAMGNKGNFNDIFRKWVWENERTKV